MKNRLTVILILTFAMFAAACGQPQQPAAETTAATETAAAPASTATGEVAFEPAYPEEVSTDTLSAEDKAQQQTHSHDGEGEHAHDEAPDHGHEH